jgi:spore germination protein KB
MNQKVIQSIHIYILMIMSTGFLLHVLIVPSLLTASHRDSWIAVVGSIVPFLIWILLLFFVYKKMKDENIISLLFKVINKPIAYIISYLFFLYFLMTAFITLKYTLYWANANYSQEVPSFVVILLFTVICFYASFKGIHTISTMAILILPLVVFFGFLVGLGNVKNKNYSLLFPIFENGYGNFFHGFIYTCSGFFEILFILFLTSYLKDKLKIKWLILISIFLFILILGPLTGVITEFGAVEAQKLKNPAYEEWKLLNLGLNITRLDFLSIFQWISGGFIRISLSMFIANLIINHIGTKKWSLPVFYLFLLIGVLIPWNASSFIFFIQNYYLPFNLIFLLCTMIFLFFITNLKKRHHV